MRYILCYFCFFLMITPLYASAKYNGYKDLQTLAWEMFDKNLDSQAVNLQIRAINAFRNDSIHTSNETMLCMISDLILFELDSIHSDVAIDKQLKIMDNLNYKALNKTSTYCVHQSRLGFYYCLAENFTLADSLTRMGIVCARLQLLRPKQSLEIYAYRSAYILSKLRSIRSLDYDYKIHKRIENDHIKEADKIIGKGLKIAKRYNLQYSVFYRYLLSMKERIEIGKIRAFICCPYSDNETNFKISNNTTGSASFMLKEYYDAILRDIHYGQIMESLRFLEPLAQVSFECRGVNNVGVTLNSLISDLYLKLYNFPKAKHYALLSYNMDKYLGMQAYRDSKFHSNRLSIINSMIDDYENNKLSEPLYAFEKALMNQGSINAQYAIRGRVEYALGKYLSSDYIKFDFDVLINELALVYGSQSDLRKSNFRVFNDYDINPFVKPKSSLTHPSNSEGLVYYRMLRHYSPTLTEAKRIILKKLRSTNDLEEKSLFYFFLAKYYFYEENIYEAIKAQKNHLNIELNLSNNVYTDKVLSAQKTLSLLCMVGMWKALSSHEEKQIELYQDLFIEVGETYMFNVQKYVETYFPYLSTREQKALWAPMSNWFYNTIPYMGMSNHAAGCIYNSAIFSKGLLLSAERGKISIHSWQEIRDKLKDGDMAIEFVNFRNSLGHEIYYALSITNNCESPSIYPLFSDFEFEDLKNSDEQYYTEYQMNDLIFKPIKIPDDVKNIYFSPTGILNTIAIENLIDSIGERACEKWNMYRLSSTRELLQHSSNQLSIPTGSKALIFGDLNYDCNFNQIDRFAYEHKAQSYDRYRDVNRARVSSLKFSRPEIDSIASLALNHKLPTILLSGTEGTEESFKHYVQEPIVILHLSTHGFYYSDEKIVDEGLESDNKYNFLFKEKTLDSEDLAMTRSALVMSGGNNIMRGLEIPLDCEDGLLTAMEISKLSLKPCELVSLSACETALGKVSNEGVFGLQRGFKIAGVQSILMSLWEVPDEATCILMQEFYKNIFSGQSKIESLRAAQTLLRNQPKFADPSNWAGWILLDGLN